MEFFLNHNYRLLKYLYENKLEASGDIIVLVTQEIIAKNLHFGKGKVNRIINDLQSLGYLDNNYQVKGSYKLTNKTMMFFQTMKKVGMELNDQI